MHMGILLERFTWKVDVQKYLKDLLEDRGARALRDYHARRKPRPCGITVHPATGCPYRCVYCYVADMGFREFKPYPLTGLEIALALASNPYIAPGPVGSLAAFGSVTEPLLKTIRGKTLEYMECIAKTIKLSCQISTKEYITRKFASAIRRLDNGLSILVTIVSIDRYIDLEPLAPNPKLRLESISNFSSEGLHTVLFLRPAIPGISDREAYDIISTALDHGARGVIVGSLRVTSSIMDKLRVVGVDIEFNRSRLRDGIQITVSRDTKNRIVKIAREAGATVYPSACSANVEAHGEACIICPYGPCGSLDRIPEISESDIVELLESIMLKTRYLEVGERGIVIGFDKEARIPDWVKYFIEAVSRRMVYIRRVSS